MPGVFILKVVGEIFFFAYIVYRGITLKDVLDPMKEIKMTDLPLEERPRERFLENGPAALSNTELLAIILRTGKPELSALSLAKIILQKTEGFRNINDLTISELTAFPGIGNSKAIQVLASIEFGTRIIKTSLMSTLGNPILSKPEDSFKLLGTEMRYFKQEHFVVLFLDVKQKLICKETLYKGTVEMTVAHPREIFRQAIKHLATSIICVHNHPSGDLTPSPPDLLFTKQLAEAGEMMNIPLYDHIIIGGDDYLSLKVAGHF